MNRPLYMLSQLFLTTVKIKKKKQKGKNKAKWSNYNAATKRQRKLLLES